MSRRNNEIYKKKLIKLIQEIYSLKCPITALKKRYKKLSIKIKKLIMSLLIKFA